MEIALNDSFEKNKPTMKSHEISLRSILHVTKSLPRDTHTHKIKLMLSN